MMKFTILLLVGVIARGTYGDAPEAIVGGFMATEGQFKHQASLQMFGQHFCGGSIISSTHIVTAAHCVEDPKEYKYMTVVTGTIRWSRGNVHEIKCIRLHPEYSDKIEDAWKNDIAVITLKNPITFDSYQSPIPLASQDYTTGTYRGLTSGWGQTSVRSDTSPLLKWLGVNILSKSDCLREHRNPQTNTKQMCTLEKRGHGVCQGDSGGPLVVNGELCGVTSWVAPCALGIADVFTNVFYFLSFIKDCQRIC